MPQRTLHMEDFISWRDSDKSEILLISAPPGRGKSVLSNFILGHLESTTLPKSPLSTKIIYYFCNMKNDEASRNASSILRALIVQLCEHQQPLFQTLPSEYERNSSQFFSASFDTLSHIFENMLHGDTYAQFYCIVDGLDVYQERMVELIAKLVEIFTLGTEANAPVLKLLCTTRPQRPILELLKTSKHRILRCNSDDLDIFIESRVKALDERFTNDMRNNVKGLLRQRAEKSFLWLEVVIRRIDAIDTPTKRTIQDTIENSPHDLDELYRLLIRCLVQRDKSHARILACVIYARRPLTLRALQDAVAINPKETYTKYEQCEQDKPSLTPNAFYNAFGTLLDVAEGKVYCIHQSVKDYFERCNPIKDSIDFDPRIVLAHVSMAYLSLEDFGYHWEDRDMLLQKFPFFEYAATHWYSHIETAADFRCHLGFQDFLKEIVPPLTSKAQVWMREHYRTRYSSRPSRISEVAIYFDIGWLAELLLNKESCGIADDFEGDCLSKAVKKKGIVLEVLLKHERSMEFTITDAIVQRIAAWHRCDLMTLLFDRRGDDVHITEEVIQAAAENSESGKEIMALLLDRRGDDVHITEEVVQAAAENYWSGKEIMALLLNRRGHDVHITEEVTKTIAEKFNQEVMTLLLDRRGDNV